MHAIQKSITNHSKMKSGCFPLWDKANASPARDIIEGFGISDTQYTLPASSNRTINKALARARIIPTAFPLQDTTVIHQSANPMAD